MVNLVVIKHMLYGLKKRVFPCRAV